MAFYSARHYRAVSPPTDTDEQIRERRIYQMASERGMADRREKFPKITGENFAAVCAYQEQRIAFHVKRIKSMPRTYPFDQNPEKR